MNAETSNIIPSDVQIICWMVWSEAIFSGQDKRAAALSKGRHVRGQWPWVSQCIDCCDRFLHLWEQSRGVSTALCSSCLLNNKQQNTTSDTLLPHPTATPLGYGWQVNTFFCDLFRFVQGKAEVYNDTVLSFLFYLWAFLKLSVHCCPCSLRIHCYSCDWSKERESKEPAFHFECFTEKNQCPTKCDAIHTECVMCVKMLSKILRPGENTFFY